MKTSVKRFLSLAMVLFVLMVTLPFTLFVQAEEYENTHINTGNQRLDIIEVAKTQIGYMEEDNYYTKYGDWYGLTYEPWCAMFVSWCARQADVPLDVLRNCAIAAPDPGYFDIPWYDGGEYTPQTGDLFFTWDFSHVGLVYYTDGDVVHTIEGNTNIDGSDDGIGVFLRTRNVEDCWFGVPDYNYKSRQEHQCDKSFCVQFETAHPHYSCYLCSVCKAINPDYSTFNYSDNCSLCAENHDKGYTGDADADRIITIKDATAIQKHIAKSTVLTGNAVLFADADGDLSITIKDATCIQKYVAGMDTGYPIGKPIKESTE